MAPSRSFQRLPRRFVMPGAAISLAVSGLFCLASSFDAESRPLHRAPSGARPGPATSGPYLVAAPGPSRVASSPAPPPPPVTVHGPQGWQTSTAAEPTPAGKGEQFEAAIRRSETLLGRLSLVDRALAALDLEESVALLERLLDRVPGDAEDVKSMRIALVSRLGLFPASGRAMNRLIATTEPGVVRNERLIAIETLHREGTVVPLARPFLERIAQGDHDLVVQGKARWALGLPENN